VLTILLAAARAAPFASPNLALAAVAGVVVLLPFHLFPPEAGHGRDVAAFSILIAWGLAALAGTACINP